MATRAKSDPVARQPQPTQLPRARGAVEVASQAITRQSGACGSALRHLRQSGSLKLLFPRQARSQPVTAVCVNTAGGVTGGDRFSVTARAGPNSSLILTTQAAERIYRANGAEVGQISTKLSIAAGARMDWLPQETILFDRAALRRRLEIDMAPDATFLAVEPLVFGRATMGERLRSLRFFDSVQLRRDGELVFADAIRLHGDVDAQLAAPFAARGAGACAAVLFAAPDAGRSLPALRALLPDSGGASLLRPGVLFARLLAPDSFLLRRSLIPILEALRGAPLPKTWTL